MSIYEDPNQENAYEPENSTPEQEENYESEPQEPKYEPFRPETAYAYSYRPDDSDVKKTVRKKKEKKQRKPLSTGALIAIALACAILGGAVSSAFSMLFHNKSDAPEVENFEQPSMETMQQPEEPSTQLETTVSTSDRTTASVEQVTVDAGEKLDASQVYAMNVASTVGIKTQITTNYFGYTTSSAAAGSGFILTADGYIITNYHVIDDADSVTVMTYDGSSYDAEIIGYDEDNDVAVLKVDAEGLVPVVLGSSDALSVGDQVVAIGNPLGELTFSLTSGYVSALDRDITMSNNVTMTLIQTDCAINSGNSGGALFNMYGEVVGITNAKYSSSSSSSSASIDNIGFAIPIDDVRANIISIVENGYFASPYIGVTITTVSSDMINYGLPSGILIKQVVEDGPAEAAGLKENDIITKANDEEITKQSEFVSFISRCNIGDTITLTIYRDSSEMTVQVVVGEKQESALPEESESTDSSNNSSQNQQQNNYYYSWPFGYYGNGSGSSNQQNNSQSGQQSGNVY